MSKYSRSLKITVARQYLAHKSSGQLCQKYNIPARKIRYCAAVYTFNQASSFLPPKPAYCAKDKLNILNKMPAEGWSLRHTRAFFKLSSPGTLFVWLRNFEASGIEGLTPKKRGKPVKKNVPTKPKPITEMSESELVEELEYLRAQNDVLKKFNALTQEKKLRAKNKRT